jgi:hypothetical protein
MPLESSAFPEEVQVAFFVFSLLSDKWEGMSGTYMGKCWEELEYIFELHSVENRRTVFFFMKIYENIIIKYKTEESEKKRKAAERKSKSAGGGKTYTHNVRG